MEFKLESDYKPAGDQPKAIKELTEGLQRGDRYQTFLESRVQERHFQFQM